MNAVQILYNVENFFDRNHNLFLLWGGLFSLIFFTVFVPMNFYSRMVAQVEQHQQANIILAAELQDMSHRVEFLELSYDKKMKVMREVECLAKNIYFEASGEPRAGKIAVAEVTMNRVKSRQYPRTVCGVVYQKVKGTCQFSWVCQEGKTIRNRSAWRESQRIAENILISKKHYGIIGTAKFFHADYISPAWAQQKTLVAQIGNHIFYH